MITVERSGDTLVLRPERGEPIVLPMKEAALMISQALVALDVVKASPWSAGYQAGYMDGLNEAWKQAAREWATRQRKQQILAQTIIRN